MNDSTLPDPDSLIVRLDVDPQGMFFTIRTTGLTCPDGGRLIYTDEERSTLRKTTERRGRKWIEAYRKATDRKRCRMCGLSWSKVSRALARQHSEAVDQA